jgi:hypothetical protein
MRGIIVGAVFALLLASVTAPTAAAQDASLEQCQALKDRIERYTALRRKGGSTRQMEGWKKQLRSAEEQFRDKDCRAYRRELR